MIWFIRRNLDVPGRNPDYPASLTLFLQNITLVLGKKSRSLSVRGQTNNWSEEAFSILLPFFIKVQIKILMPLNNVEGFI
jgi:hypothetical protein